MELDVALHVAGTSVASRSWTLTHFDEAEKIGQQVGRMLRDFIRTTPLRIGPSRLRYELVCTWRDGTKPAVVERAGTTEAAAPKPRRKKRAK